MEDLQSYIGLVSCGAVAVGLLLLFAIAKAGNKTQPAAVTAKAPRPANQGQRESENVGGDRNFAWMPGDGEPAIEPAAGRSQFPKYDPITGAAEPWQDFAERLGQEYADAQDRERNEAEYRSSWNAAHAPTVHYNPDPEVFDTKDSQANKQGWH